MDIVSTYKIDFSTKELNMAWKGLALATLILGTAAMSGSLRATAGEDSKTVTFNNFAGQAAFLLWQTGHKDFQPGE